MTNIELVALALGVSKRTVDLMKKGLRQGGPEHSLVHNSCQNRRPEEEGIKTFGN